MKTLIDKFLSGETTIAEEKRLKQYFAPGIQSIQASNVTGKCFRSIQNLLTDKKLVIQRLGSRAAAAGCSHG